VRRKSFELLAQLTKPIGLKGVVGAVCAGDLDLSGGIGLEVWLVPPPAKGERKFIVAAVNPHDSYYHISFAGIDNVNDLGDISGRYLLVETGTLEYILPDSEPTDIGKQVVDVALGTLGVIVDSYDNSAYTTWVIGGPFGELLVPAVDEYFVDSDEGTITLKLPEGFVETGTDRAKD
jgi:16S rRNA processing protein RimM